MNTLQQFQEQIAHEERHILIGYLKKNPGPRILHEWATYVLHTSYSSITMLRGGYFEIHFKSEHGKTQTLTKWYKFNNQDILFSTWRADFDPKSASTSQHVTYPIWAQLRGLRCLLRTPQLLTEAFSSINKVIAIDPSETYRSKVSGPRVRILVDDITKLLYSMVLPNFLGGKREYIIDYSGLPIQCNQCRNTLHHAKNCPLIKKKNGKRPRNNPPHSDNSSAINPVTDQEPSTNSRSSPHKSPTALN